MNFLDLGVSRDMIATMTAAIAVFCAVIGVGWPYLARDTLGQRMRQVTEERERLRMRERAGQKSGEPRVLLQREPRRVFAAIVQRLNLLRKTGDGEMVRMLRIAGYRGRAPVIAFLALRVLMPVVTGGLATFYIFVVIRPEVPLAVQVGGVLIFAFAGYHLPRIYVKNKGAKRKEAIRRSWPDALDLLLICVESGMSSESAFRKVAEEIGSQSRELAEELSLTTAEMSYLLDRRAAYENLAQRTDLDGVRSVVSGLTQSEKYGTSLGQVLRVLAQENRDMRMSVAAKKAAALPPKLTVPMIVFFLPVLFAVIIAPAAIQIIAQ